MQKIPPKFEKKDLYWLIRDKYHGKKPRGRKRLAEFEKDIKRLFADEPLDYIIGWKPFLNCKIDLSYKPHAPVPETEFWTEKFIETLKNPSPPAMPSRRIAGRRTGQPSFYKGKCSSLLKREGRRDFYKILDAFSGSGCIGIAILKNIRNAKVDFSEIEPRLIKQIKHNLKINRISPACQRLKAQPMAGRPTRYRVIHSNVLKNIRITKYNYILANPPYVAIENKKTLKPWALKYWPQEALFGGKGGFYFIRQFLKQAKSRLKKGGQIWMELDPRQKTTIAKLIKQNKYSGFAFHKDQFGRTRYVVIDE